jgi:transposase-like protein
VVAAGDMTKLLEVPKDVKENLVKWYKGHSAISGRMDKVCYKCKTPQPLSEFGKLKSSTDGHRYDCKGCRKQYRENNKQAIQEKQHTYYAKEKDNLLVKNKEYRQSHEEEIRAQRKAYRERPEIKQHIQEKNREYLPIRKQSIKERRKSDSDFRLTEILRSKIHKMIRGQETSYKTIIGCDFAFLKQWLEFRFDSMMTWDNLGSYWQIDHILPISSFDFTQERDKNVCFHWTNLQPLPSTENNSKTNNFHLHYYFNNIVNVVRFNTKNTQFLGYQTVNESLRWLRVKLRYGNNPPYEETNVSEMDNQQPSSYVRYDKDMEKVQRVDDHGLEGLITPMTA